MPQTNTPLPLRAQHLLGVGLISLCALVLEIVLTRVFSVTMRYHFAFVAISMALMGSAAAGMLLYFFPRLLQPAAAQRALHLAALALALAVPLTFVLYLRIPFQSSEGLSAEQIAWLGLIYLDLTVPFFLSGLILALALAVWPAHTGRLYWADLTGAALGCLCSIAALQWLGGVGAVFSVSVIAALAALTFSAGSALRRGVSLVAALGLAGLVGGNAAQNWFALSSDAISGLGEPPVYERWNVHSQVTVYPVSRYPFFWSVDQRYWDETIESGRYLNHALLLIDSIAGTPIQEFRGQLWEVEFLRYDLSAFAYHLVPGPYTLVIGPGGGRDVLAALAAGSPEVTAVEVNPAIIEAVRGPFGEFSGGLYDRPDVRIAIDDARGFIERLPDRYDIIQASLIDTWAAGGSGAYALSENSLYTVEAFGAYYAHLTDRGVLTISRWYLTERPAETLRLLSTGLTGWERAGVADARQHVVVVARPNKSGSLEGMATALFKRAPFTPEEVAQVQAQAEALGFTVLYAPGLPTHETVGEFVAAADRSDFIADYPLDISPATDDRPFFFNIVRLGDLLDPSLTRSGVYRTSMEAILLLLAIVAVLVVLGALFILGPLWAGRRRRGLPRPSARLLVYFAMLGLGFIMVEIPTIQALTLLLGRPVYSLAAVLFSLLLFSGLGSLWSSRLAQPQRLFPWLVGLVGLHALGGSWLLHQAITQPFALRLALTVALLAVLGFLMGMPFPVGMRWAGTRQPAVVAWLWGINGLTSVLGSALAIVLAIHLGLQATLLIAATLYAVAGFVFSREVRLAGAEPQAAPDAASAAPAPRRLEPQA